jgi:putative lipoprotein
MRKTVLAIFFCVCMASCNSSMSDQDLDVPAEVTAASSQVTGTLLFRERIALRPGSMAEVWLLDTSLADAAAKELAYQKIENPGNPPIPFVLDYDATQIDERMQYSVRATIKRGEQLLFTTDTHYPVLTRGAGSSTELMLVSVNRAAAMPDASLTNVYWKLTSLGEDAYKHEGEEREPHLKLVEDGSMASGFGGCNGFSGTYVADGNTLRLGPLAVTQRACISGMETEMAFLAGLNAASRFTISGDTLTLYEGDSIALSFEAVHF